MASPNKTELYLCVDVETAGPIPVDYSLLSIGACNVFQPESTFYVELKPVNENCTPEAYQVHRLSLERLQNEGLPPITAMQHFEAWITAQVAPGTVPVFVGFNAVFDWAFINYYFIHYIGHNPFGHAALDIKAYYMGQSGMPWSRTSWRYISPQLDDKSILSHHALQDALDQAKLFEKLFSTSHHTV